MKLSPFVRFLELIDSLADVNEEFFENRLQRYRIEFLKREWVKEARYLTHHMVDYFDDAVEVEIEVDENHGVYRYPNPQRLGHIVSAPLWEVTLYSANLQRWLDDLSDFIGIAPENRLGNRDLVANQVWCLGEIHVAQVNMSTKVILARRQNGRSDQLIKETLEDKFDPSEVIVLVDTASNPKSFGDHPERCFADFVSFESGLNSFDRRMLERIAVRASSQYAQSKPKEFLDGRNLMLVDFETALTMSAELTSVVNLMWGTPPNSPPVMTWKEVNATLRSGYQSFYDICNKDNKLLAKIFDKVSYGRYRVRRQLFKKP